jgi:mannose-6-phosphate isomerase-like protein (cupin superfamily)
LPWARLLRCGRTIRRASAAVEHRRIYRPWGYYQDVDISERYRVKRIVVKPGSKLSLQKHFHRSEHWVVVKGTAEVTVGDDVRILHENESTYIPIGRVQHASPQAAYYLSVSVEKIFGS